MFFWDNPTLRAFFAIGIVLSVAIPGERYSLPVFLGGISYPLYLNHWTGSFVGHGFTRHVVHEPDGLLYIAIAYSTSIVIAAVAYLLIDRNVLAKRQQWFTRWRGAAFGATAYMLLVIGVIGGMLMSLR
jgi:peptidoglycan/LPS O-acetylase OafA/YrhL